VWWPKWAILGEIGGARDGVFEPAKSEKSGEVKFCRNSQQVARERRHHLCNERGVVAAPDWRDLNRRREIEEGMNFTKMHKKLKS
jgi:hypothetical protein